MTNKSYDQKLVRPAPLFIGIDLGTSGCRAIAIDDQHTVVAQSQIDYPQNQPQTPELWWLATQTVIKNITAKINHQHIQSIAVDGTSGTVLLCNEQGEPLTPALMYHDHRASQQAEHLKKYAPKNSIVLNSSSGLAKVLWLIENYPPTAPFHIVHQADWISGQLCRSYNFSDINNALKTGYDAVNQHWPLWMSELGFAMESLPVVYSPGTPVKMINLEVAHQLGLPIDVDIVAGTTDSTAAFIASLDSQVKPGDAVTSLGSTLVVKVVSDFPVNDPERGIYSQPYDKFWLVGGASNSGGAVLKYFFTPQQMQTLSSQINPETPANLNYYPLLTAGERFPINDPQFKPRITPKVEDDVIFFQGLLEGIADIEHSAYKLLHDLGTPYPTLIRSVGGGAKNAAWQQIRQHKTGVPIVCAKHSEAAYGAALIAAKNFHSVIGLQHDQ